MVEGVNANKPFSWVPWEVQGLFLRTTVRVGTLTVGYWINITATWTHIPDHSLSLSPEVDRSAITTSVRRQHRMP